MWKSVVESVLLAAETLRKALGVANSEFLPYEAHLTLLAYVFLKSGRRALSESELVWLESWFWRSSFGQYYGSAGPTKMGRDKDLLDQLITGQSASFNFPLTLTAESLIDTKMTQSRSAIRNAFLCLLARRNPVHLINNTELDLVTGGISDFTSPEKHHIFPQAYLRTRGYGESAVYTLPNFCFVPAELNKRILNSKPSDYIGQLGSENPRFSQAAKTHLLPIDIDGGLNDDNYEFFINARADLIVEEIERLTGISTAPEEGREQRAINELETALRDLIHTTLTETHGQSYWTIAIPKNVQEIVESKISVDVRRNPELKAEAFIDHRKKLNYFEISDYRTVILCKQNWPLFEPNFGRAVDVERRMEGITIFRNALSHNRSMTELERQDAKAALVWFRNVLSPLKGDMDQSSRESSFGFEPKYTDDGTQSGFQGVPFPFSFQRSSAKNYHRFMKCLIDEMRESHGFTNARKAPTKGGYGFPSGIPGVLYAFDFAKHGRVRVSLYIDTGSSERNKSLFDSLFAKREAIEREFGQELDWKRLDMKRASRVGVYRPGTIRDSDVKLNEIRKWATDRLLGLKRVFGPFLAAAKNSGESQRTFRRWDENSFLDEVEKGLGSAEADVIREILNWCRRTNLTVRWGEGNDTGSFTTILDCRPAHSHNP